MSDILRSLCALLTGLGLFLSTVPVEAEEMAHHHDACVGTGLDCALVATPLFAKDGSLWLIWATADQVSLARSADLGHSFGPAVTINAKPLRLDTGGDGRPVVIEDAKGRLISAFAYFKDDQWNARALVATSTDRGQHFSPPHAISDDPASQRFPVLAADRSGDVFAAWIDKRIVAAAKTAGHAMPGASLAFAWSRDGGETFGPGRIFQEASCECCRLALAMDDRDRPTVLFRAMFPDGVRDHGVIHFLDASTPGPMRHVADDHWVLNGCPHHGPALAVSASGALHAAWFTQGSLRKGVFYARAENADAEFSAPMALSSADRHPARPAVLAMGKKVWLVWKETEETRTTVRLMDSNDDGSSWSAARIVAETTGTSDHPLLIGDGHHAYLSWLSRPEGYRLIPLETAQ